MSFLQALWFFKTLLYYKTKIYYLYRKNAVRQSTDEVGIEEVDDLG